jgi:hypothetical protein
MAVTLHMSMDARQCLRPHRGMRTLHPRGRGDGKSYRGRRGRIGGPNSLFRPHFSRPTAVTPGHPWIFADSVAGYIPRVPGRQGAGPSLRLPGDRSIGLPAKGESARPAVRAPHGSHPHAHVRARGSRPAPRLEGGLTYRPGPDQAPASWCLRGGQPCSIMVSTRSTHTRLRGHRLVLHVRLRGRWLAGFPERQPASRP